MKVVGTVRYDGKKFFSCTREDNEFSSEWKNA